MHVLLGELNEAAESDPGDRGHRQARPRVSRAQRRPRPTVLPADARACRFAPEELYEEPMFHGPDVARGALGRLGRGGTAPAPRCKRCRATECSVRASTPSSCSTRVLLDAAGQLIGFWAADRLDRARVVFPFRMASLDLLAPPPAAGEAFECRAAIELRGDQLVNSDIEVIGADGLCRLRLRGWEDKRFDVPPAFHSLTVAAHYEAAVERLARRRAGGRTRSRGVPRGWVRELGADAGLWKQVWACRVLSRREREMFAALSLPPRRQLEWLAARTAAKEAVSALVRDASGVELLPAEIEILSGRCRSSDGRRRRGRRARAASSR